MSDAEIPSREEIERALKALEELLTRTPSESDLVEALGNVPLGNFQLIRLRSEALKSVFRARQPNPSENLHSASTFSAPLPEQTRLGRANRTGFPVFYASLLTDTAIQETLDPLKGDIVYVGEWAVRSKANIKQFLHPRQALDSEVTSEYHNGLMETLRRTLGMYSPANQVTLEYLVGKIGDYFLRKDDYRISSLLGHQALYEWDAGEKYGVDMISYPSVVKAFNAMNFAIAPNYAREHLELVAVRKYRVKEMSPEGCHVELLAIGTPSGLVINWHRAGLDVRDIRREAAKFEAYPDTSLRYEDPEILIDGKQVALSSLFDEVWEHEQNKIIDHVKEQLFKGPIDVEAKKFTITTTACNRQFQYEGCSLDEIRLSLLVEYRFRLKALANPADAD